MSNSSRIEAATRQHVGAVLSSEQIVELVKLSDPNWKGGVYSSDAAYSRNPEGQLQPRGKVAYGDGVLEYLGANSFKVLETKDIVRRPNSRKATPAPTPTPVPAPAATAAPAPTPKVEKKAAAPASKPPAAPRTKAKEARPSAQW